jgi:RNA polymerase sigma factor (sigma-70 family)
MNATEIRNAWSALTPKEQEGFCTACVKRAIRQGRTLKPGYDLDDATQEAFVRVLERLADVERLEANCKRREAQGKPDTLASLVCRAANSTLQFIAYNSGKHSKDTSRTIHDQDGNELDLLETVPSMDDTEREAILRTDLRRFIAERDAIDQWIISRRADGLTEREIAAGIGISNVAVHKRLVKLQQALRAVIS